MAGVTIAPTWQVSAEKAALEEKLRMMAACPRIVMHLNIDRFFDTILACADYNARHPEDPVRPQR